MHGYNRFILRLVALCLVWAQASLCCSTLHAIVARGEGPGDDYNVLTALRDAIKKGISGSDVVALPYDHANSDRQAAAQSGALLMQKYIENYVAQCPKTKIAIFGYSLGAVLTMDSVCGVGSIGVEPVSAIDPKYAANVIAVIAYGDETHAPFMPWNKGSCDAGVGYYPRVNFLGCIPFKDSIQSYCDIGDTQCCTPVPPFQGVPNAAHHQYFGKYDGDVVTFIKNRLAETK